MVVIYGLDSYEENSFLLQFKWNFYTFTLNFFKIKVSQFKPSHYALS